MNSLKSTLKNFLVMGGNALLANDIFDPFIILVYADREPIVITRPVRRMSDNKVLRGQVKKIIRKTKPVAALGVMPAWILNDEDAPGYQGHLKDHPKRQEIICIYAKDARQHLIGAQQVFRSGNDISLGEVDIVEGGLSWFSDCQFSETEDISYHLAYVNQLLREEQTES
jgi:hypothetical protein